MSSIPSSEMPTQMHRLERLQSFLAQDPDNLSLLADTADEALKVGDTVAARTAIEHALTIDHGNPYFRLRLSSAAIAEGSFDDALAVTSALLEEGVTDSAVRYNHAYALLASARYEDAKGVLESLLKEGGGPAGVVPLLLRCHHYLGDLDSAIEVATAHLGSNPEDSTVEGMLSLLYFDKNDYKTAGERARRVLASNGDNLDALLAAGGVALAEEDGEGAKSSMMRAISVQPRNGRAWANLGLAEMLGLNLTAAQEALAHAVKYMPEHVGTWIALGWTQLMLGDLASAEHSFQCAVDRDENFSEGHGGLAAVAAMKGDWDAAELAAKTARRLDPASMSHQYVQLIKMIKGNQSEAASRLLQRALAGRDAPSGGTLIDMLNRVVRKPPRK